MRRRSGASADGREEAAVNWGGQSASHTAAAAAAGGKTAGAVSVDRGGATAALDARKSILLVKLSADGLPVHKSLRHKDANRWVVGTNVSWCHAEQHSQLLASTCNSVALVWDANKTHPIYALREHKRSVNAICWHPLDGTIATCSADSYIHVWDVRTPPRRPAMSFCAWTSGATCIAWSLGDENVLASSHDNEVRLWDRRKGTLSQPTAFITAHRHSVRSLAWRPGMPKALLTLSQDGAVKLWDTDEPRECKADLEKQIPYSVQLASWAPFGDGLLTAGNNGETTLWSVPRNSSGPRFYDTAAVDLNHVVSLHDQGRQQKLRDLAWRTQTPTNPYQLCSLSVTGELRTQSMTDDWTAKCHVENKPSQPSKRHPESTDAHSRHQTPDKRPSNRHDLKKAVDMEVYNLEQSAVHAGRLKFDRYTESGDRVTVRLRIEARKPMQSQNTRTSRSAEIGHVFVDISFPEGYPQDHSVPPTFDFDTSALWSVSDSVASSLRTAVEKYVAELANASVAQEGITVGKVCMGPCIDRAVQILDGPLGTGKQREYSDGDSDLKTANADQRERKGYTPCPVLSAGVFSGPGYFVTFNNGLPFVVADRRTSLESSAGGTLSISSPTSLRSPQQRPQSSLQQRVMTTPASGHMDGSPSLLSPTATHMNASGIAAATMQREYRGFLQELGRPLQDASKPNLSAMIMGGVAAVDSSTANEYGVSSTRGPIRLSSGSSGDFAYHGAHNFTETGSSAADERGALSAWKWNAIKVVDRSYIDIRLAHKYIATLADVDCSPRESCKRNAVHAENNGLAEVAQTW
jgi:WD40 repeat protein